MRLVSRWGVKRGFSSGRRNSTFQLQRNLYVACCLWLQFRERLWGQRFSRKAKKENDLRLTQTWLEAWFLDIPNFETAPWRLHVLRNVLNVSSVFVAGQQKSEKTKLKFITIFICWLTFFRENCNFKITMHSEKRDFHYHNFLSYHRQNKHQQREGTKSAFSPVLKRFEHRQNIFFLFVSLIMWAMLNTNKKRRELGCASIYSAVAKCAINLA